MQKTKNKKKKTKPMINLLISRALILRTRADVLFLFMGKTENTFASAYGRDARNLVG